MFRQQQQRITPDQALQDAYRRHQAGDLHGAKGIYEQLLSAIPHHPAALTMLASIAYLEGNDIQAEAYRDTALRNYREAVKQAPQERALRAALVNILLAADRPDEARDYLAALDLPLNPLRHDRNTFYQRRLAAREEGLPPILLNTIPKSASESIWNRLAEGLNLGQCHVSIGLFPHCTAVPFRMKMFSEGGIIAKEHLAPDEHNVAQLAGIGVERMLVHLRDPRQITLSWAHFVRDDISHTLLGPLWRQSCPPAKVLNGDLSEILDWCIETYLPRVVAFMTGWQRIAADPATPLAVEFQTFERFRTDPDGYFRTALKFYGLDGERYGPDENAADVHLRQGSLDEWREVFNSQQKRRAEALIGPELLDAFGWPRR